VAIAVKATDAAAGEVEPRFAIALSRDVENQANLGKRHFCLRRLPSSFPSSVLLCHHHHHQPALSLHAAAINLIFIEDPSRTSENHTWSMAQIVARWREMRFM
jgi:hypothetical protein